MEIRNFHFFQVYLTILNLEQFENSISAPLIH